MRTKSSGKEDQFILGVEKRGSVSGGVERENGEGGGCWEGKGGRGVMDYKGGE